MNVIKYALKKFDEMEHEKREKFILFLYFLFFGLAFETLYFENGDFMKFLLRIILAYFGVFVGFISNCYILDKKRGSD